MEDLSMLSEFVTKILSLGAPNIHTAGDLEYSDKNLNLIYPPAPKSVECRTLQGLVDLYAGELDDAMSKGDLLAHITSPTTVELVSRESDDCGRRRVWAEAKYPGCKSFPFGAWLDPESFIIAAQQHFQRVKIENDDGTFAKDLDYVLKCASQISAEAGTSYEDDGITQKVAMRSGVTLKTTDTLRPIVSLAPYRTFAEIDQVLSTFVFRARVQGATVNLALFEGDGGRWQLAAVDAIAKWLEPKIPKVPVIS
jgi:hypothetical protein